MLNTAIFHFLVFKAFDKLHIRGLSRHSRIDSDIHSTSPMLLALSYLVQIAIVFLVDEASLVQCSFQVTLQVQKSSPIHRLGVCYTISYSHTTLSTALAEFAPQLSLSRGSFAGPGILYPDMQRITHTFSSTAFCLLPGCRRHLSLA